ncbi:MAG: hypothetical protein PHU86_02685 [Patescibacteria group bacterium]|nr:hypothetical protein [Patescibacteria group bacterium]
MAKKLFKHSEELSKTCNKGAARAYLLRVQALMRKHGLGPDHLAIKKDRFYDLDAKLWPIHQ